MSRDYLISMNHLTKIQRRIQDCNLRLDLIKAGLFQVSKEKEMELQGEIAILKYHEQREKDLNTEIDTMISSIGCYLAA